MNTKYYTVKEILDACAKTTKGNDKKAILEANKDNHTLRKVCMLANNPYVNFFMKKIPDYEKQHPGFGIPLISALNQLEAISSRKITGAKAKLYLTRILESVEPNDAEVIIKVVLKNLRSGFSVSTINKIWCGLIPVYPCMLAESYNESNIAKIRYPAVIQEKMDGLRVNFLINNGKVDVKGRSGKPIMLNGVMNEAVIKFAHSLSDTPHYAECANIVLDSANIVLDGELLVVDEHGDILERKTGNGILNKDVLSDDELSRVRFVIWDAIPLTNFLEVKPFNVRYKNRWDAISDTFYIDESTYSSVIGLPETQIVNNIEESKVFFRKMLKEGKEGSVLKNFLGVWENKRSKDQVKLKLFVEFEMEVVALEEGKNDCLGKLGAFSVKSKDGLITTGVGSGLDLQQRKEYWEQDLRGRIITIKSVGITSDVKSGMYSLDLPIFIELRDDKSEANTFEEIEEMFRVERSLDE